MCQLDCFSYHVMYEVVLLHKITYLAGIIFPSLPLFEVSIQKISHTCIAWWIFPARTSPLEGETASPAPLKLPAAHSSVTSPTPESPPRLLTPSKLGAQLLSFVFHMHGSFSAASGFFLLTWRFEDSSLSLQAECSFPCCKVFPSDAVSKFTYP